MVCKPSRVPPNLLTVNTAKNLGFIFSDLFSKSVGFFSRDYVHQNTLGQIILEFTYTNKFSSNVSVILIPNFYHIENPFKIHSLPPFLISPYSPSQAAKAQIHSDSVSLIGYNIILTDQVNVLFWYLSRQVTKGVIFLQSALERQDEDNL